MVALITPDELRNFLDVGTGELADERASEIIEGVSGVILAHLNRTTLEVTAETLTIDGNGYGTVLLPVHPIVSVASLVEDPRGDTPVTLVDDVDFEWSAAGILTRLDGRRFARRARFYVAEVEHGYPATPDAVKLVAKRIAARAVTNPEGLATESAGGYVSGFAFDATRLPTVSAPDRRDLAPFVVQVG